MKTVILNINQLVTVWESDIKYEDYKYLRAPTMLTRGSTTATREYVLFPLLRILWKDH